MVDDKTKEKTAQSTSHKRASHSQVTMEFLMYIKSKGIRKITKWKYAVHNKASGDLNGRNDVFIWKDNERLWSFHMAPMILGHKKIGYKWNQNYTKGRRYNEDNKEYNSMDT